MASSSLHDYHIYEEVGRSEHSFVYRGRKKYAIEFVAVKRVELEHSNRLLNQVSVLCKLSHPNILQFHAWYRTSKHAWTITEFCAGGSLHTLLKEDKVLPEASVRLFARDIASGLQYLHSKMFVFGDLKPTNILFNEYGILKLSDFGLARAVTPNQNPEEARSKRGTPYYLAPEHFSRNAVAAGFAADIWSFGCIVFEMAMGALPFRNKDVRVLAREILYSDVPAIPNTISALLQDLITRCLEKEPDKRMKWHEICSHRFWRTPIPLLDHATNTVPSDTSRSGVEVDLDRLSLNASKHLERNESNDAYNRRTGECTEAPPTNELTLQSRDRELVFTEEQGSATTAAAFTAPAGEREERSDVVTVVQQEMEETLRPQRKIVLGSRRPPRDKVVPAVDADVDVPQQQPQVVNAPERPETIQDILQGPVDVIVQPIIGNLTIEPAETLSYRADLLPFRVEDNESIKAMTHAELEKFLSSVYVALGSNCAPYVSWADRVNVLKYFCTLCYDVSFANCIVNSGILTLLVELLDQQCRPEFKRYICFALGILIRHATKITSGILSTGIFQVLSKTFGQPTMSVRRRAMATMGELLYYISSQFSDHDPSTVSQNLNEADWLVPEEAYMVLRRALRAGVDDIVRHYAAKSIENIAIMSHRCVLDWFSNDNTIVSLVHIYESSQNEALRVTVSGALWQLLRRNPVLCRQMLPMLRWNLMLKGLEEKDPDALLSFVSLVNLALECMPLPNAELADALLECLFALGECGGSSARARSMLALGQLTLTAPATASVAVSGGGDGVGEGAAALLRVGPRFCSVMERVARDRHELPQRAVAAVVRVLADFLPPLVERAAQRLAEKQPDVEHLQVELSALPFVAACAGSVLLRPASLTPALLPALATLLLLMDGDSLNTDIQAIKGSVYELVEIISNFSEFLLRRVVADNALKHLLPALATVLQNHQSDTEAAASFFCLKAIADIASTILESAPCEAPSSPAGRQERERLFYIRTALQQTFLTKLLPLYHIILADKEPMPQYGLRLLSVVLECDGRIARHLQRHRLTAPLLSKLEPPEHASIAGVKVVRALVKAVAPNNEILYELGLLDKLNALFAYSFGRSADVLSEPIVDIIATLLDAASTSIASNNVLQQNEALLINAEILLAILSASHNSADLILQEKSARCVLSLIQLYPGFHHIWTSTSSMKALISSLDSCWSNRSSSPLVLSRVVESIWWLAKSGKREHIDTLFRSRALRDQLERLIPQESGASDSKKLSRGDVLPPHDIDRDVTRFAKDILLLLEKRCRSSADDV